LQFQTGLKKSGWCDIRVEYAEFQNSRCASFWKDGLKTQMLRSRKQAADPDESVVPELRSNLWNPVTRSIRTAAEQTPGNSNRLLEMIEYADW